MTLVNSYNERNISKLFRKIWISGWCLNASNEIKALKLKIFYKVTLYSNEAKIDLEKIPFF